jgi:hypothetical protein
MLVSAMQTNLSHFVSVNKFYGAETPSISLRKDSGSISFMVTTVIDQSLLPNSVYGRISCPPATVGRTTEGCSVIIEILNLKAQS